ncbi:hypothetical protein, partial [Nocardia amamiensis]|uniref:hypothetical protein n=1 Tax=Nocardia amamiensis TaxID=404578 RepID=UPI000AD737D4
DGHSDASRAANGQCQVSLRSKTEVEPVWARWAVTHKPGCSPNLSHLPGTVAVGCVDCAVIFGVAAR